MNIITRAEARAAGLKKYFTGEPCNRWHFAGRYVKSNQCIVCSRDRTRAWCAEHPEKTLAWHRSYYAANRKKADARHLAWRTANRKKITARQQARRTANRDAFNLRARGLALAKAEKFAGRPRSTHCESCGEKPNGKGNGSVVHRDHVHDTTEAFRGWLCIRCNLMIGLAHDDKKVMRAAIGYLWQFEAQNKPGGAMKKANGAHVRVVEIDKGAGRGFEPYPEAFQTGEGMSAEESGSDVYTCAIAEGHSRMRATGLTRLRRLKHSQTASPRQMGLCPSCATCATAPSWSGGEG